MRRFFGNLTTSTRRSFDRIPLRFHGHQHPVCRHPENDDGWTIIETWQETIPHLVTGEYRENQRETGGPQTGGIPTENDFVKSSLSRTS